MHVALFDADGVLQRAKPGCFDVLSSLSGGHGDPLGEIFAAERPAALGQTDFVEALTRVLQGWGVQDQLDVALQAWCEIEPDGNVLQLVDQLRESGVRCFVASNQHRYRADFMSRHLGYAEHFDGELYSYNLGAAKPDTAFFAHALRRAKADPATTIFIDDSLANIEAATALGISTVHARPDAPSDAWIDLVREACL
jgi:putative hydrolase of the HAD superfamily